MVPCLLVTKMNQTDDIFKYYGLLVAHLHFSIDESMSL